MKTIWKEYKVYKFDELNEDIQEKVLQKYIENDYNFYCECLLEDDMEELAIELLQEHFKGSEFKKVLYDLSYSQGSGSMIEFNIDLKDLNNKYKQLDLKELEELEEFGGTKVSIYHNGNAFYQHEYTYILDYNDFTCFDYEWENIKNIELVQEKIVKMMNEFEQDIITMNKELTKKGYEQLENEEYFLENAKMVLDELEFLENGEVFCE